jgi:hypothetical protein
MSNLTKAFSLNLVLFVSSTLNDCYIKLGYKYELVSVYDLDEYVFPRGSSLQMFRNKIIQRNKCEQTDYCTMEPFQLSLYEYFKNIMKNNYKFKDVRKLQSILMMHAIYHLPETYEQKIIESVRKVLSDIESNEETIFPIKINISRIVFVVESLDVQHLKYLVKYFDMFPCFTQHIANITTGLDLKFRRYLYHTTHLDQRVFKSIHNTQNVAVLFCHYAWRNTDGKLLLWRNSIRGDISNGEFLSHFREEYSDIFNLVREVSIQNLNVDFEYVSYMLKTHTHVCKT